MKSIRDHHPELAHATPHKLRHTGADLPKQAGTSIEAISEPLTPSDMIITKTDVNIPMAVGEIAYRCLNNGVNHKVSVNVDIAVLINVLR
jgi:integrase/recombinase, phage integrase family